ncbi:TPA: hypothetical protein N0F65_011795 [Lagenidium giganteum]|uniref:Uncharacterized protein n=1 Tax=Lagenidium giganteum TaxID=4803 RepID=A0AAV2YQS3_9STRA|nr:TPA: hypothetical protein N0F65_011795 [Lagenidium giganteum]
MAVKPHIFDSKSQSKCMNQARATFPSKLHSKKAYNVQASLCGMKHP